MLQILPTITISLISNVDSIKNEKKIVFFLNISKHFQNLILKISLHCRYCRFLSFVCTCLRHNKKHKVKGILFD